MNQWSSELDAITYDFKSEFGQLSAAQLNWKPDAKTWSIAENIEHLIVLNSSYFQPLAQLRNGNYPLPWTAKVKFLVNFFGKVILKSVQPDNRKKMKTFPLWEPEVSDISDDILERFEHHQKALKEEIEACVPLVIEGKIICSPANFNIVYRLETAIDILITHEMRHLAQAKEVWAQQKNTHQ